MKRFFFIFPSSLWRERSLNARSRIFIMQGINPCCLVQPIKVGPSATKTMPWERSRCTNIVFFQIQPMKVGSCVFTPKTMKDAQIIHIKSSVSFSLRPCVHPKSPWSLLELHVDDHSLRGVHEVANSSKTMTTKTSTYAIKPPSSYSKASPSIGRLCTWADIIRSNQWSPDRSRIFIMEGTNPCCVAQPIKSRLPATKTTPSWKQTMHKHRHWQIWPMKVKSWVLTPEKHENMFKSSVLDLLWAASSIHAFAQNHHNLLWSYM